MNFTPPTIAQRGQLAKALQARIAELEASLKATRDEGFNSGTVAALGVVTAQDCGVTWREIVQAAGVQQILIHAITNDGDWEWAGFKRYATRELGAKEVAKARRTVREKRSAK